MVFDFLKYADDYDIPYVTENGNLSRSWLAALDCPWCGTHGKYHLGIPEDGSRSYCWSCGHHSLHSTIKALTPQVNPQAIIDRYGDTFSFIDRLKKEARATTLDYGFGPLTASAKRYLEKRGFDPDYIEKKYDLRWGGLFGDWAYRIIAPIRENGEVISWQGRTISKEVTPKYKFLPIEMSIKDPKSCLWNIENCEDSTVIVTEGIYDCMKWGDGACAVMGIRTTEAQARKLAEYQKVIILFDPEREAQRRALKFAYKIASMSTGVVEVADTEDAKDLGATSFEEMQKIKEKVLTV